MHKGKAAVGLAGLAKGGGNLTPWKVKPSLASSARLILYIVKLLKQHTHTGNSGKHSSLTVSVSIPLGALEKKDDKEICVSSTCKL